MKVLDEIKFRIPYEILQVAFASEYGNFRKAPFSLDNEIMNSIIRPRVLVDADLVGGQVVLISLNDVAAQYIDDFSIVYEIPAEKIMYRTIMSVLSVTNMLYSPGSGNNLSNAGLLSPGYSSNIINAGQRVMDSHSNVPNISNARVDLVGHNTVLIRNNQRIANSFQLRCVVGNEENLSNFNPRHYHHFSKLVELAVKSYIYNKLIIKIDQAYLLAGQDLGSVKTYIDNLSDAEQMYQDYLINVIQKISLINNTASYERFIKLQINPGL